MLSDELAPSDPSVSRPARSPALALAVARTTCKDVKMSRTCGRICCAA